jgi:predicted RNase H-like HicB family nuclease
MKEPRQIKEAAMHYGARSTRSEVWWLGDSLAGAQTAQVAGYRVVLIPDREAGGYNVVCPALRGCRSQGDTVEEALDNIADAIALYLETVDELVARQLAQAAATGS